MLDIVKDAALDERGIYFGLVEVHYPEPSEWQTEEFRALVRARLETLLKTASSYDRKTVFSENPYFRFFRKFKKTYPVMMQLESFLLKGRPFPFVNPVTELPFLAELETRALMGTHDVERIRGRVTLLSGTEKTPFIGLRGDEVHTYPGDVYARDGEGIILSMIAGADVRTHVFPESRHVFYPVFGTPGMPAAALEAHQKQLADLAAVLSPSAKIETQLL